MLIGCKEVRYLESWIKQVFVDQDSVLEISQLDLEVWCSETFPDAPSILGNLAGISV